VPVPNAGSDQSVESDSTVKLDGGSSSDPLDNILTYRWTQIEGAGVALSYPSAVDPTFTAPDALLQLEIVFEL
jgi:chitinase